MYIYTYKDIRTWWKALLGIVCVQEGFMHLTQSFLPCRLMMFSLPAASMYACMCVCMFVCMWSFLMQLRCGASVCHALEYTYTHTCAHHRV